MLCHKDSLCVYTMLGAVSWVFSTLLSRVTPSAFYDKGGYILSPAVYMGLFFPDRFSISSKASLEFEISIAPLHKCWDCSSVPPCST